MPLLIDGQKPKEIFLPLELPKNVVFELLPQSTGRRILEGGKIKPTNSEFMIPMRYTVGDPNTGNTNEVIYSGSKPIQYEAGHVKSSFEPEPFVISGDVVKDKKKDAEFIYAMINSIYCADNPRYKNHTDDLKPIFRVKNLAKTSKDENLKAAKLAEALGLITNPEKVDDAKVGRLYKAAAYADAHILIENQEFDNMRNKLIKLAQNDVEKFFAIYEDGLADVRIKLQDALDKGVISYSDKGFVWGKTSEAKKDNMIFKIPKGKEFKEAVELFINFLKLKDESGVYDEIKRELR